eukprot:a176078_30.p1 GENE.a176078_30~~a176078_30.p1  ORF type:complete len:379 (-),score=100.85 a176078_30:595-1704(-)
MAEETRERLKELLERQEAALLGSQRRFGGQTCARFCWALSGVFVALTFVALALRHERAIHPRDDDLFIDFPASNNAVLSSKAVVSMPFHAYDARATIVSGHVSLAALNAMLDAHGDGRLWRAVSTTDGRGIAIVWLMKYNDSTAGPYNEIVVSFAVSARDGPDRELGCSAEDAFCGLAALNCRTGIHMLIYKLWLDSQLAIDIGRELLGCDKYPAAIESTLTERNQLGMKVEGVLRATFALPSLHEAFVARPLKTLELAASMIHTLGLRDATRLALQGSRVTRTFVTSAGIAHGVKADVNALIPATLKPSPTFALSFRAWDNATDSWTFTGELESLGFVPALVQFDPSLRFVMMLPHNQDVDTLRRAAP